MTARTSACRVGVSRRAARSGDDLLIGKPVILGAKASTARHALVVDEEMRSLFAFLRTLPVPMSVFASTEDWSDAALAKTPEAVRLRSGVVTRRRPQGSRRRMRR